MLGLVMGLVMGGEGGGRGGEEGEGTLLLRGGGGAVREAKGPRDGFGVFLPV